MTEEIHPLRELVKQQAQEIARLRETLSRVYQQQADDLDEASDAMEFAVKERDGLKAEIAAMEANQKAYVNVHALWLTAKDDRERKDALLRDALTAMKYHTNQTRPIENTFDVMDMIKEELK